MSDWIVKLLERIAQDCIDDNRVIQKDENGKYRIDDFTAEQCQRYMNMSEDGKFWGGYAYIDDEEDEVLGSIRLYSPWGDAKWSFFFKDGKLVTDICYGRIAAVFSPTSHLDSAVLGPRAVNESPQSICLSYSLSPLVNCRYW